MAGYYKIALSIEPYGTDETSWWPVLINALFVGITYKKYPRCDV